MIDEAALSGEPIPVTRRQGELARSGTLNAGETFEIRVTATAGDSTYAGIVRMVTAAQTAKAPFIRMADRYALLLLPITIAVAGGAWLLLGRSRSGARRAGRRNAVSAHPGGAGCAHRRGVASRAARHPHQGRRTARGARAGPYGDARQDRDADGRGRASGRDRGRARRESGRDPAVRRLGGAGLASRGGEDDRRGRRRQGARPTGSRPRCARPWGPDSKA